MNMLHSSAILILTACFVSSAAHAAPAAHPALGDVPNGAKLFRLNCASCHGTDARGNGPLAASLPARPPNLRDGSFLLKRDDDQLTRTITTGGAAHGKSFSMPAFPLAPLEVWDLLAFLRDGQFQLTEFFSDAARYTSKSYQLEKERMKRIEPVVGALSEPEREVTLVGVFKGQKPGDVPVFVPQNPRDLDSLRPENKLGYLSCLPVAAGLSEPILACMALNERGIVTAARVAPFSASDADRARLDKVLAGFVGQGGKSGKNGIYVALTGSKGTNPALAKSMTRAYYRTLAAVAMFDKEELDRNPFD